MFKCGLAAVEFNDELDIDVLSHFFASRLAINRSFERSRREREPCRNRTRLVFFDAAGCELLGGSAVANFNLIADAAAEARNVDLVAVHANVAVADQLASGAARIRKAQEIDNAIQAHFEEREEVFTDNAAHALCAGIREAELLFAEAIHEAELLFFIQADGVFRSLATERRAVNSRRIRLAFLSLAGRKDVLTEAAI